MLIRHNGHPCSGPKALQFTFVLRFDAKRNMKLRHAAALALVGWYLMMPPVYLPEWWVDPDAPLPQWTIEASFDTPRDCELRRRVRKEHSAALWDYNPRKLMVLRVQDLLQLCIATDDPRLKDKLSRRQLVRH